jgi:hypothetical protein
MSQQSIGRNAVLRSSVGVARQPYRVTTPCPGKAFAAISDEPVNSRRDNGERDRAKLEHGIVKS